MSWRRPKTWRVCEDCGKKYQAATGHWGPECRWKHRGRVAKKYVWTSERDAVLKDKYDGRKKGRAQELARMIGWPKWVITRRAQVLGLCYPAIRQDWLPVEEAFLMEHAGSRTVHWMAQKLKRGMTSVALKLKRMKISAAWREGYTLRELELCFGIDHHGIDKWIRAGQLVGRRRGTNRKGNEGRPLGIGEGPADPWYFTDADLVRFITEHPLAFRLDKVDQVWFMDLLTAGGIMKRALEAVKGDAA